MYNMTVGTKYLFYVMVLDINSYGSAIIENKTAAAVNLLFMGVGYWRYYLASQWILAVTGFLRRQRSDAGGKRPGR